MEISVYRYPNGLELATIHNGYRVSRFYVGYTITQAKKLFREYVRESEKL